jgi:hypothetical protein
VTTCLAVLALGLILTGCDWSQLGFSTGHTGDSSNETTVNASNVSSLRQKFFAAAGTTTVESQTMIANGVLYAVSNDGNLYAFSATGSQGCSGTPLTCAPLWSASILASHSAPVVANGMVYVMGQGGLYALDADGKTNCSGSPVVCRPLWQAPSSYPFGSPTVANGTVYISSGDGGGTLEAFDANGLVNCSGAPKICSPIWSSTALGLAIDYSVAISNDIAYLVGGASGIGTTVYAFDASGTTHCSGTPKVCSPLWQYSPDMQISGYPVVSGNTLYIDSAYVETSPPFETTGMLEAFDANGGTNCSGTPKVCAPIWQSANSFPAGLAPIVTGSTVFVPTVSGPIAAFATTGLQNCSGEPRICAPKWTTSISGAWTSAVVGGNVLFAEGLVGNEDRTYAFDASGVVDCSATFCSPLLSLGHSVGTTHALSIANGMLYLGGSQSSRGLGGIVWAYGLH